MLDICPLDHPCHAVAQSNLATANLIHYQVYDIDASFDVPLTLYHNTLAACAVGHPDRPSMLIQLAAVFKKQRDEVDAAHVEVFLQEVMDLSSTESHENQIAIIMLQLRTTGVVRADCQSYP